MVYKCTKCRVQYWDSLTECPYCGIPNLRHQEVVTPVKKEGAYERVMRHKVTSDDIQS